MIFLMSESEADIFAKWFSKRKWNVTVALEELHFAECLWGGTPDYVLVGQDTTVSETAQLHPDERPGILAVVNDNEEEIIRAKRLGADFIVTRPIDPENPMGYAP